MRYPGAGARDPFSMCRMPMVPPVYSTNTRRFESDAVNMLKSKGTYPRVGCSKEREERKPEMQRLGRMTHQEYFMMITIGRAATAYYDRSTRYPLAACKYSRGRGHRR